MDFTLYLIFHNEVMIVFLVGKGVVDVEEFEESDEDIDLVEGLEADAGINYMDDSLDDATSPSEENFDIDDE